METLVFIMGLGLGLFWGKKLTEVNWIMNAHNPQRILHAGNFYKVILIDDLISWNLAKMHCDFHSCRDVDEEHPQFENFIRAFWRRIEPYKGEFEKELPEELPVCFRSSMATAILQLYRDI